MYNKNLIIAIAWFYFSVFKYGSKISL